MHCDIKNYKVNVLPSTGQPNARYYVPNGDGTVSEYITDKEGNFLLVASQVTLSATLTSAAIVELQDDVSALSQALSVLSSSKNDVIEIQTEGSTVTTDPNIIDFVGSAVSVYLSTGKVVVHISIAPGGGGSGSVASADFVSLGNLVSNNASQMNSADTALYQAVSVLSAAINGVSNNLSAEIVNRISTDSALQSAINVVSNNLSTEINNRIAADSAILSNLSTKNQIINIQNEGSTTQSDPQTIDFQGAGVDVQVSAGKIEVIIAGASGQTENFSWRFDPSTVAADPGVGDFRLDNATLASVTQIFVDDICDTTGFDISNIFNTIQGDFAIYIQQNNDATKFVQFTATAPFTDNTGWFTIPVTYVQEGSGGLFDSNTKCTWYIVNKNGGASVTSAQLVSVNNRVSVLSGIVSAEISARTDGDSALSIRINSVADRVSANSAQLSLINSALATVSEVLSVHETQINDLFSANDLQSNAISTLSDSHTSLVDRVSVLSSQVTSADGALSVRIDTQSQAISVISQQVSALSQAISALSNTNSAAHVSINQAISVVSNAVSIVSAAQATTSAAVTSVNNRVSNISADVTSIRSVVSSLSTRLSDLTSVVSALSQANSAAHASINQAISVVSNAVSIVSAAQAVTSAELTSVKSVLGSVQSALSALSNQNSVDHASIRTLIAANSADFTSFKQSLNNIGDVSVPTPGDGNYLVFNSAAQQWLAVSVAAGAASVTSAELQSGLLTKNNRISIQDEGSTVILNPDFINFVGNGVTVAISADGVVVQIDGGGGSVTSAEHLSVVDRVSALSAQVSVISADLTSVKSALNTVIVLQNVDSVDVSAGAAVYAFTSANTFKRGDYNAPNERFIVGLVQDAVIAISATGNIKTDGTITLTSAQWDDRTGNTGGLSAGEQYYLTPIGNLSTDNFGGLGRYIGTALDTNRMLLQLGADDVISALFVLDGNMGSIRSVVSSISTRLSDLTSVVSALSQANSADHVSIRNLISVVSNAVSIVSNAVSVVSAAQAVTSAELTSVKSVVGSVQSALSHLGSVVSALSQANSADHVSIRNLISVVSNAVSIVSAAQATTSAEVTSVKSVLGSVQSALSHLTSVVSNLSQANSAAHASIMAAVSTKNPTLMILSADASLLSSPTALNFTGAGVQVSVSGTKAVISILGGSVTSAELNATSAALLSQISIVSNAVSIVSAAAAAVSADLTSVKSVVSSMSTRLSDLTSVVNTLSNANSAAHVSINNAISVVSNAVSALSQANSAAHVSIMTAVSTKNPTLMILSAGVSLLSSPTSFDFTGAGVQVSISGTKATISIGTGGGGSVTSAEYASTVSIASILRYPPIESVTSATYSVVAADQGKVKYFNNTASIEVILPDGLVSGFQVVIYRGVSAGPIRFSATTSLESQGSALNDNRTAATFIHRGSNLWIAAGAFLPAEVADVSNAISVLSQQISALSQAHSALSVAHDTISALATSVASVASALKAGHTSAQMAVVQNTQTFTTSVDTIASGLSVSLAANATYHIMAKLIYSISAISATGYRWILVNSATTQRYAVGRWMGKSAMAASTGGVNIIQVDMNFHGLSGAKFSVVSAGTAQITMLDLDMMIGTSTTAGSIGIAGANIVGTTTMFLYAGSFMRAYRIQ